MVFLTGGGGYLGSVLVKHLRDAGCRVRLLARRPPADPLPRGTEIVQGDLSDPERLARQMEGCRAIFHCAALVAAWASRPQTFYDTNVHGLRNILSAVRTGGIRPTIYTSSFFALGPAAGAGADENSGTVARLRHPYQHSKFLARLEARRARSSGFPIVILYPGVIYGPGRSTQGNLVATMITDFMAGRLPGLLGNGRQVWSFAFIDDVARGHILAWQKAPSGGEFILGGDNVAFGDFIEALAALVQKPAPRIHIPPIVASAAAAVEFLRARVRGRAPHVTPASVRMMYDSWACNSARAQSELGYKWRPLEEGLRETLSSMSIPIRSAS